MVASSGMSKPAALAMNCGDLPGTTEFSTGFDIPEDATILAAECKEVSDDEPLTHKKLAPVESVPATTVANAYRRSVEGIQTGRIYKVGY